MEGTGGLVNGIRPPTADLPGPDHRFHPRDHAEPGVCVCVGLSAHRRATPVPSPGPLGKENTDVCA